MADFITHTIFSKEVLYKINNIKLKNEIKQRMKLFILGAQGPDIFYYYFSFIFRQHSREHFRKIGNAMHNTKTGDFLKLGIEYAFEATNENDKYDLITYILGFICHFHLDRSIHPYVCYCSKNGIYKKDGTLAKASHQDIETSIDIIYSREKEGKSAQKTKLYNFFSANSVPYVILDFFNYALKVLFSMDTPHRAIKKSIADMRRAFILLYDPLGLKKTVLTSLGINTPKPFYTASENSNIDWLNRNRNKWCSLECKSESYALSVDDLYITALKECSDMITCLYQRIKNQQALDDLFPNISYITNKPC